MAHKYGKIQHAGRGILFQLKAVMKTWLGWLDRKAFGQRPKARPSQPNQIFMTAWLKSITCTTKLGFTGLKALGSGEPHQARLG